MPEVELLKTTLKDILVVQNMYVKSRAEQIRNTCMKLERNKPARTQQIGKQVGKKATAPPFVSTSFFSWIQKCQVASCEE